MADNPRSFRTTEATDRQIDALQAAGYGSLGNIIRIAIDRMAREETDTMSFIQYKEAIDKELRTYGTSLDKLYGPVDVEVLFDANVSVEGAADMLYAESELNRREDEN